jgi:hypothetical protein
MKLSAMVKDAVAIACRRSKSRTKRPPKRVLALPDLEHAKTAVLSRLTSASGQRTYDRAIASSSPGTGRSRGSHSTARLLTAIGSTSSSAHTRPRRSICGWPPFAVSRARLLMSVLSSDVDRLRIASRRVAGVDARVDSATGGALGRTAKIRQPFATTRTTRFNVT